MDAPPTIGTRDAAAFCGDSRLAVDSAWETFRPSIRACAQQMTKERDEQQDLEQEAMIALWKADPTRYDLGDPGDAEYLRRILINRMWHVWGVHDNRFLEMAERHNIALQAQRAWRSA